MDDREQLETERLRLHLLDALVAASVRRVEVLEVVGRAEDSAEALRRVRDLLDVEEVGARAVLDTQLGRFTSEGRSRLVAERDACRARIDALS